MVVIGLVFNDRGKWKATRNEWPEQIRLPDPDLMDEPNQEEPWKAGLRLELVEDPEVDPRR